MISAQVHTNDFGEEALTVLLEADDLDGNSGMALREFLVDRGPPVVLIDSPKAGEYFRSAFTLDAAASDTNLASFGIEAPAGLMDQDADPGHIVATVTPGPGFPDGPLTLQVRARDQSGQATDRSVQVTLDTVPPWVSVASPAAGFLQSASALVVSGTAGDATTDVDAVEVEVTDARGGVMVYPATLGGSAGNRSFQAMVMLGAKGCEETAWTGQNVIRVRARDLAGNWSEWVSRQGTYDPCAPRVQVVPTAVDDERSYQAAFKAESLWPCLFRDGGTVTTTLSYDVNAPVEPAATSQVYKYAVNTAAGGAGCPSGAWEKSPDGGWMLETTGNPVVWRLNVVDNVDLTNVSVEYQVKGPADAGFGPLSVAAAVSVPGVTHEIRLTKGNAPGLDVQTGVWQVRLVVKDTAGNTANVWTLKWNHHVLGGPVYVSVPAPDDQEPHLALSCSGSTKFLKPADYSLLGNNMNQLYTAPGSCVFLQKVEIGNGTPYPVDVRVAANAEARWRRWIRERNPANGSILAGGTGPSCSPDAFSPPTNDKACLGFVPKNADLDSGYNFLAGFVSGVRAFDVTFGGEPTPAAACAGQASCWTVPAAPTPEAARKVQVYLLSSAWTFLWDGNGAPADLVLSAESGSWSLFGRLLREWGQYRSCGTWPSGEIKWCIDAFKEVRYLQRAQVAVLASSVNRTTYSTRPGAGGSFQGLVAVPSTPITFSYDQSEPSGP